MDGLNIFDNKIKDNKNQILYLYQRIKKHGNESLIREFCFSSIAERILKSTIDHDFADLKKRDKRSCRRY